MPKIHQQRDEVPDTLRPYIFHGVDLAWRRSDKEAIGECPFCGREGKFSISLKTGEYRCFVCEAGTDKGGGNKFIFLRKLWSEASDNLEAQQQLAKDRGLLQVDTLVHWGIVQSIITGDWLVPAYGLDGRLKQLYRYISDGNRKKLLPTPTIKHYLFGMDRYDTEKSTVYLCEGVWDAMVLWETLAKCKPLDDGFGVTSNLDKSLLANINILAVPGCTTFYDSWAPLFSGKNICLLYDNDHPRKHPSTDKYVPPAGDGGMKRVAGILSAFNRPPESITHLDWSSLRP